MGYYRALREIRDTIPSNAIIVSEGSNTMDIGRTVLPNFEARHRLDAGTFGTMGVGLGFAIAAAVTEPNKKVIAVEGDSAFGFSGMEVEVACRFGKGSATRLPAAAPAAQGGGSAILTLGEYA